MFSSYGFGYMAREQGIGRDKNPFPSSGEWYQNWNKGWDHADREHAPKKLFAVIVLKPANEQQQPAKE